MTSRNSNLLDRRRDSGRSNAGWLAWAVLLVVAVVLLQWTGSPSAAAQDLAAVTFSSELYENNFPDGMNFGVTVESEERDIVSARFAYRRLSAFSPDSTTKRDVDIVPGKLHELEFSLSLQLPPSAPLVYYWEVTTEDGQEYVSEEVSIRYDDTRFDWMIVENDDVAVWWHDQPEQLGQDVFEIAVKAIDIQSDLFGADLVYQVRIILYNSFEEFAEWNPAIGEFIGGQAYVDFGVTAQILGRSSSRDRWLNDVIPHEISHLYLEQVTGHPGAYVPKWLNEGLAQFNEFAFSRDVLTEVARTGKRGDLIPLTKLANGFGSADEERARLAYKESLTAVSYMVEVYGQSGVSDLLAAYHAGIATEKAFLVAFDVSMEQFQLDWVEWLGVPTDKFVIPTPWPSPTFRSSPTPFIPNSGIETPTVESPTKATATKEPFETLPVATIAPASTSVPEEADGGDDDGNSLVDIGRSLLLFIGTGICCGVGTAALIVLYAVRRNSNKNKNSAG